STAKTYSVKGEIGVVSGETDTSDNKKTISMEVIPVPVHDMAVTKVYTSQDSPIVGQATTIYVTVKNEGNQQENSVPVKAYVDGSKISTQYVTLSADQSTTKSFTWTPSVAKTYSVKGEAGVVSGETDTSDNSKTKSVTVNPAPVRDMAVTDVQTSPDLPTVGQSTTIYVTVKNKGNQQEKNVPVKAYADGSQVGSAQVTLSAGKSATKSFIWTPSTAKTYSVRGEIGVVSGETDTSDNKKIIGVSVSPAPSPIPPTTPSPQTGSIRVTTNLDIAFFTITGPETYQAIGKSWSISNVPAGLYTITYTEIPGYIIPSSETKTLSVGGSITFSGSYTKIGLYQLPATRGKISWFSSEESGNPGAWGEWLGENLGTDEATKYWYCAMRWPYYDPNTGFFDQAAKDWWHNKKILLTNPKNDKQVVLAAKDWGPTWWTGRVIDVSKTALDTLGVETDDIVNIEFADQNA
ncbi:MAG: hypothetical protein KAT65_18335, partial [Methanophagales archaeon]|nr:hypothetical protein [Methanophagales archaeon]